ncbi:MAG: hypothetical protein ACYDCL_05120 [Myxococcales bacterium]
MVVASCHLEDEAARRNLTTKPKAITPAKLEAELRKLDQAVQNQLSPTVSLEVDGQVATQPAIDGRLQGYLKTFDAVEATRQAHQEALAARLAITVEAREYEKALKAAIKSHFGRQSAVLTSFGIAPDKALSATTVEKVLAAAKRGQTRAVRGTKGKRQRLAVTVVGDPPITVAADGTVHVGAPPVNLPTASDPLSSTTPVGPTAAAPAPAGPGSVGRQ